MRTLFLPALLLFLPQLALAQGHSGAGNGGRVILCKKPGGEIEASPLDYWEALTESGGRGFRIRLGKATLTEFQKVDLIISRIARFDADFARELAGRFIEFKKQYDIQDRYKIGLIPDTMTVLDTGNFIIPKGDCHDVQGAVQLKQTDAIFTKKFLFDKDCWKRMSADNRAGLIFHEILYWSEIENGATNSLGTRRINAYFSSNLYDGMTMVDYLQLMRKHSLRKRYSVGGAVVSMDAGDAPEFETGGRLVQARLIEDFTVSEPGFRATCRKPAPIRFDASTRVEDCAVTDASLTAAGGEVSLSFAGKDPVSLRLLRESLQCGQLDRFPLPLAAVEDAGPASLRIDLARDQVAVALHPDGRVARVTGALGSKKWLRPVLTRLTLRGAEVREARFEAGSGRLSALIIQAQSAGGTAWLTENGTSRAFELSWKRDGKYEVALDASLGVVSVR